MDSKSASLGKKEHNIGFVWVHLQLSTYPKMLTWTAGHGYQFP